MEMLGIRIDGVTKQHALKKVAIFLQSDKLNKIFTPNPEMIVDAQKDAYFKEVLNSGDLNLCDGKGIQIMSKEKIERISGSDFILDVCKLAEQQMYSVYFLGSGSKQVITDLQKKIKELFPKLEIKGGHPGPRISTEFQNDKMILNLVKDENDEIISEIAMQAPDILFVAFGHGKQEKWIHEHQKDLPSIKVVMGVGGAFDYISGHKKRAPKWLRKLGLEWMYRLVREPRRFKRIWKATVIFTYYCIKRMFREEHESNESNR